MTYIDLNADVGEGLNNESDLMPYLSSCNIACGGHAGDQKTMRSVVELALKHNVKIGAHPSFPDRLNFGRKIINISETDLYESLKYQIESLQQILDCKQVQMHHFKPHGALYNLAAKDEQTARVIIDVIKHRSRPLKLYAPFNSVLSKLAKIENIDVTYEAFGDRMYNSDGSLVSRKLKNAVLTNGVEILMHVLQMVNHHKVTTIKGEEVPIEATTFCIHGDTKNALEILQFLSKELPKHNINIQ